MCPQINPDFTEALENLPAGEYKVRVTNAELKTGKESGAQYLNWKLETYGKDDDRLNGRVVYHTTPIQGKGAGILKSFLKAVGVEAGSNFDTEMVYGKELMVVLVDDPTGQSAFPKVKGVKPLIQAA